MEIHHDWQSQDFIYATFFMGYQVTLKRIDYIRKLKKQQWSGNETVH